MAMTQELLLKSKGATVANRPLYHFLSRSARVE